MKQLLTLAAVAACFATSAFASDADLAPLTVVKVAGKSILANAQGLSVYTFDPDSKSPGKSVCNGSCAVNWPPVAAPTTPVKAPLSVIVRDDGSKQLAYLNQPVYLFKNDKKKGDLNGENVGGIWHSISVKAGLSALADDAASASVLEEENEEAITPLTEVYLDDGREILADAKGLSVYTYDPDLQAPGKSVCNDDCAVAWPPVLTTLDTIAAPLSIVVRDDGTKQIAYDGKPLYLYIADSATKQINGDNLGGVWHIVLR